MKLLNLIIAILFISKAQAQSDLSKEHFYYNKIKVYHFGEEIADPEKVEVLEYSGDLANLLPGSEEYKREKIDPTFFEHLSEFKNLKELHIYATHIDALPLSLLKLKKLKCMKLAGVFIKSQPTVIARLKNLKVLYISSEQFCLDSIDTKKLNAHLEEFYYFPWVDTLEHAIGYLTNLRVLSLLNSKHYTDISAICPLQNLERLDLTLSELKTLPECIGSFSKLKTLKIHKSQIAALPDSIYRLKHLKLVFSGICSDPMRQLSDQELIKIINTKSKDWELVITR